MYKSHNVTVNAGNAVLIEHEEVLNGETIDEEGSSESDEVRTAEMIVKAAQAQAGRIVQAAELKVAMMVADAEENCRELEEAFQREAYKQGYEEGFAKGEVEVQRLQDEAKQTLDDAVQTRDAMLGEIEPTLIDMIIRIVEKIIGTSAALRPQLIQVLIKQAISDISTHGGIKIRVSSEDYPALEKGRDGLLAAIEGGAEVEIVKDLSLGKNDCIIETPYGTVDCSLDGQLEQMKESLHLILKGE